MTADARALGEWTHTRPFAPIATSYASRRPSAARHALAGRSSAPHSPSEQRTVAPPRSGPYVAWPVIQSRLSPRVATHESSGSVSARAPATRQ